MGSGRIEQVDHRDHILQKPNSTYVAKFLGLNVYSGRVVDHSAGLARVAINGIEISAASAANLNKGAVLITLKPEDVVLSSEPTLNNPKWRKCTCNNLEGTITQVVQMKSNAKVTVDVGFPVDSELTLSSLEELGVEEGSKVHAHFKADSLSVSQP